MKIGNKLKSLRANKGYSSELVAEKLGISLITYRRYERNESVPDLNMLEKIATTYEIPITELFANENIVFNTGQNGGTSNNAIVINQLSEKLIEQYELRLKEKEAIIIEQRLKLDKFEK
jgi:transcriptional regulator with XRE-family HTH domain